MKSWCTLCKVIKLGRKGIDYLTTVPVPVHLCSAHEGTRTYRYLKVEPFPQHVTQMRQPLICTVVNRGLSQIYHKRQKGIKLDFMPDLWKKKCLLVCAEGFCAIDHKEELWSFTQPTLCLVTTFLKDEKTTIRGSGPFLVDFCPVAARLWFILKYSNNKVSCNLWAVGGSHRSVI